jgi:hypothetical protein
MLGMANICKKGLFSSVLDLSVWASDLD